MFVLFFLLFLLIETHYHNYILIDTTVVKHIDAITSANNLDKSIASGVLNPYKAQKYCNMLPCEE